MCVFMYLFTKSPIIYLLIYFSYLSIIYSSQTSRARRRKITGKKYVFVSFAYLYIQQCFFFLSYPELFRLLNHLSFRLLFIQFRDFKEHRRFRLARDGKMYYSSRRGPTSLARKGQAYKKKVKKSINAIFCSLLLMLTIRPSFFFVLRRRETFKSIFFFVFSFPFFFLSSLVCVCFGVL